MYLTVHQFRFYPSDNNNKEKKKCLWYCEVSNLSFQNGHVLVKATSRGWVQSPMITAICFQQQQRGLHKCEQYTHWAFRYRNGSCVWERKIMAEGGIIDCFRRVATMCRERKDKENDDVRFTLCGDSRPWIALGDICISTVHVCLHHVEKTCSLSLILSVSPFRRGPKNATFDLPIAPGTQIDRVCALNREFFQHNCHNYLESHDSRVSIDSYLRRQTPLRVTIGNVGVAKYFFLIANKQLCCKHSKWKAKILIEFERKLERQEGQYVCEVPRFGAPPVSAPRGSGAPRGPDEESFYTQFRN